MHSLSGFTTGIMHGIAIKAKATAPANEIVAINVIAIFITTSLLVFNSVKRMIDEIKLNNANKPHKQPIPKVTNFNTFEFIFLFSSNFFLNYTP